ncbi:cobalamin B12-binding domain-containing protein [Alkaliphilus serpentinus]|uniref:Cobalamin B12-binding domain-containing protein n=1 Tax=Alkaliphilus serpentinus TaxID=1482731 RepID=A0A833HLC8_9FIRM|nr:cobalamin-dependent protein [Alkaliphilus serpentinus]KAB3525516.1 cobalamin B12-binding domain-containing protein [Alkaliphilus serpentinus]
MNKFYHEFMKHIESEDKISSLNFVLNKLQNNEIDILTLYNELLAPALNTMTPHENERGFIWKEHIRSSIVRTIIENCYPYVLRERDEKYKKKNNQRVAVVCPTEEYHEIGARMVTDFFTLLGYNATFVGSNTPKEQFIEILESIHFDYIAISVSNSYNLIAARKTVDKIKEHPSATKIIVGGRAIERKESNYKDIGADFYFSTFKDLANLHEEGKE